MRFDQPEYGPTKLALRREWPYCWRVWESASIGVPIPQPGVAKGHRNKPVAHRAVTRSERFQCPNRRAIRRALLYPARQIACLHAVPRCSQTLHGRHHRCGTMRHTGIPPKGLSQTGRRERLRQKWTQAQKAKTGAAMRIVPYARLLPSVASDGNTHSQSRVGCFTARLGPAWHQPP